MPKLTLYHLDYCPFCVRVRSAAARLDIDLELIEISEQPDAREHLLTTLGRSTVPVLGIGEGMSERLMPESRDIIAWLEANVRALHGLAA
ncbi:MAG: glutaredoxin [Proteobacteria bacterium]|nr:glutaredoxin [Pseudomonadota bacterium]